MEKKGKEKTIDKETRTIEIAKAVEAIGVTIDVMKELLQGYPFWLKVAIVNNLMKEIHDDEMRGHMTGGFFGDSGDDMQEGQVLEKIMGDKEGAEAFRSLIKKSAKDMHGGKIPVRATIIDPKEIEETPVENEEGDD